MVEGNDWRPLEVANCYLLKEYSAFGPPSHAVIEGGAYEPAQKGHQ